MELFLFGFNVLLLMAVWRFMLRRTILDHFRDHLFDLRDELRATYVEKGWSLNSPMYKKLRDLTNGYLRFTEDYSLLQYAFLQNQVRDNVALSSSLKKRIEQEFSSVDAGEREYVQSYRRRALEGMLRYMIFSSGWLIVATALATPFIVAIESVKMVKRGMSVLYTKVDEAQHAYWALANYVVAVVAHHFLREDFVEEYSYRRGIA